LRRLGGPLVRPGRLDTLRFFRRPSGTLGHGRLGEGEVVGEQRGCKAKNTARKRPR
jgi:hypothetical protein